MYKTKELIVTGANLKFLVDNGAPKEGVDFSLEAGVGCK